MAISVNYNLILVEDDANLGFVIQDFLETNGFKVTLADSVKEALMVFNSGEFNLALLDVMLPDGDGFSLASQFRRKDPDLPLIFLTAKSMPDDRIAGLKIGADDYITKPFQPEELKLRIEAVLRRYEAQPKATTKAKKYIRIGEYRFFPGQLILKYQDQEIAITATETALLEVLCEEKNGIVTREKAFRRVWGTPDDPGSRTLDVYVGKLRKLLQNDPNIIIRNIHGVGYRMEY